jgi:hypothetical protein
MAGCRNDFQYRSRDAGVHVFCRGDGRKTIFLADDDQGRAMDVAQDGGVISSFSSPSLDSRCTCRIRRRHHLRQMGNGGGLRLKSIFTHKVMDPFCSKLLHSIRQDLLRQVDPVDITLAGFRPCIRVGQHQPIKQPGFQPI